MTELYRIILRRRTIRRFKQRPIPYRVLKKLINTARVAPSAANLQPIEYIIITDKKKIQEVFSNLRWAAYITPKGIPPEDKRPVAYIAVLVNTKKAKRPDLRDVGAAVENIIITAKNEGIGSCWLGAIDKRVLRRVLKVPSHCKVDSMVALGYPDEKPVIEELISSVRYYKDRKGILHVPKRSLSDILHKEIYGVSF